MHQERHQCSTPVGWREDAEQRHSTQRPLTLQNLPKWVILARRWCWGTNPMSFLVFLVQTHVRVYIIPAILSHCMMTHALQEIDTPNQSHPHYQPTQVLKPRPTGTVWKRGSTAKTRWQLTANHGGTTGTNPMYETHKLTGPASSAHCN